MDESEEQDTKKAADPISDAIGEVGKWQAWRVFIAFLVSVPGLCHIYGVVFSTVKTDYWCLAEDGTNGTRNECVEGCDEYGFDTEFWARTVLMEYQLVCDRSYLVVPAKIVVFLGYALGTSVAGVVSDRIGRRSAISFFSQLLFGTGILLTIMPDVASFMVVWFFVGVAAIAVYTVAIVWSMEIVGGKWKTIFGFLFGLCWAFSRLLTAFLAYVSRDWRILLQVISCFHLFTPIALHFVPESPRWLLSTGNESRMREARGILEEAAKANGITKPVPESIAIEKERKESFMVVFRTPILLKRTLILFFNWFVVSFIIYGLNLNWQALTGSVFLNFVVFSCLDIPAKIVAMFVVQRGGRRLPYVAFVFASGVMLFLILAFEKDVYYKNWPIALLGIVGSVCISLAFSIMWIYTTELYHTAVRNSGVGAGSFMARIGGVLATTIGLVAEKNELIPPILFGSFAFVSAAITTMLPETGGRPLPKNLEEILERRKEDEENSFVRSLLRSCRSTRGNHQVNN